jgi:hypothetical protein
MKTKLRTATAILSVTILSFTVPMAFAGHGGGRGAGFSGGHGGGSHSYSAGGMRASSGGVRYSGMRSYGGRSYSGATRMSNSRATGRTHGNYATRYHASSATNGYRIHNSHPVTRHGKNAARYGALNYSNPKARLSRNRIGNQTHHSETGFANHRGNNGLTNRQSVAGRNANNNHSGNLANRNRFDQHNHPRNGNGSSLAQAKHNNSDWCHHHNHDWWHHHCNTIVFVGWGWWGWYDGWWYPCWGYDPYYSYYPYDGPIYGYGNLQPDEVVADVQNELQRLGYFYDSIDGVLGPRTQQALIRFQHDHGLPATGTVDQETVGALGLS